MWLTVFTFNFFSLLLFLFISILAFYCRIISAFIYFHIIYFPVDHHYCLFSVILFSTFIYLQTHPGLVPIFIFTILSSSPFLPSIIFIFISWVLSHFHVYLFLYFQHISHKSNHFNVHSFSLSTLYTCLHILSVYIFTKLSNSILLS